MYRNKYYHNIIYSFWSLNNLSFSINFFLIKFEVVPDGDGVTTFCISPGSRDECLLCEEWCLFRWWPELSRSFSSSLFLLILSWWWWWLRCFFELFSVLRCFFLSSSEELDDPAELDLDRDLDLLFGGLLVLFYIIDIMCLCMRVYSW